MEKLNKNTSKTNENVFSFDNKIKDTHKKELGLNVPNDYFSTSKKEILNSLPLEKKGTNKKMYFILPIAAAIVVLFTLTVFKPNLLPTFKNEIVLDTLDKIKNNNLVDTGVLFLNDDVTLASLFVEDDKLDEFVDQYIIDDIINNEAIEIK